MSVAERAHRVAVDELMMAFRSGRVDLGNIVLAVNVVVPGPLAWDVASADDVAYATARSLGGAGHESFAGVAVGGNASSADLLASLYALHGRRLPYPLGFRVDGTILSAIAAVWKGRPDHVDRARRELRAHLDGLAMVGRVERPLRKPGESPTARSSASARP
ncbi:hypothetical protein PSA01_54570 [Pseudonocardia saturnea]|nr:hypothetical protein Pdca_16000 [Pseudonocardia autotrophica]GEC28428.1 hypothetical protein PSA01_54570 [Pseudonocardia saturnea]